MNQTHFHWGDSFVRSSEWRRVANYVRTENQVMSSPCNATATSTHAVFLKFISNQIQLHTFQLALEIRVLLEMLPFFFSYLCMQRRFPAHFWKENPSSPRSDKIKICLERNVLYCSLLLLLEPIKPTNKLLLVFSLQNK